MQEKGAFHTDASPISIGCVPNSYRMYRQTHTVALPNTGFRCYLIPLLSSPNRGIHAKKQGKMDNLTIKHSLFLLLAKRSCHHNPRFSNKTSRLSHFRLQHHSPLISHKPKILPNRKSPFFYILVALLLSIF